MPNEVFGFDLNKLGIRTDSFTKYHYFAIGGLSISVVLFLFYFVLSFIFCRKPYDASAQNTQKTHHQGKDKKKK